MGNNTTTVPGLISGAGGLLINNPNTTAVLSVTNAANSFTGPTTINANATSTGILSVATLANIGTVSNIGAGLATSTATNAASLVFTGVGAPILLYTGAATSTDRLFTITGTATGSPSPTLYANGSGALTFSNANAIAFGGTANASTLTFSGTNTAANTFAPIIGNSGATTATTVVKAGPSTWALTGANTYSGATSITGGNLSVSSINTVAAAVGSNGTTSAHLASSSLGAPTTAALGTINLGGSFVNFPAGGAITSTNATLTYTGVGETTDRVINLASTSATANIQTIDQSGTGNLQFTSAFTATGAGTHSLTLQGSTAGTGEISGAIVNNSATNTTSLTKAGTGTWTLSGVNTFTGATLVSGGTLVANRAGALGTTSGVSINNNNTLTLNVANTLGTGVAPTAGGIAAGTTTSPAGTVPVTLSGGTLLRGAAGSQGSGSVVGMGLLTLTAGTSSAIDFGTSGSGTLTISAFAPGTRSLLSVFNDNNVSGLMGIDGTNDRLIFNQDLVADGTIGDIAFNGNIATSAQEISLGNGLYEILPVNAVPAPEPSTCVLVGLLCVLGGGYARRQHRMKA